MASTYSASERAAMCARMAPSEQVSWSSFRWQPSSAGVGKKGEEGSLMFVLHNSDVSICRKCFSLIEFLFIRMYTLRQAAYLRGT